MFYSVEDVTTMLDALLTDGSDTDDEKSSASDSESEFDLSDPEAGVATDEDELFVSQPDESISSQQVQMYSLCTGLIVCYLILTIMKKLLILSSQEKPMIQIQLYQM